MKNVSIYMPIFDNEEEAADVIAEMWDIIDECGFVTVANLKEMVGIKVLASDYHYGWTSETFGDCAIRRLRPDKYYITLTPAEYREGLDETPQKPKYTSPDPDILNITIHINELENPTKIIDGIFKHISDIKGRTINITIM